LATRARERNLALEKAFGFESSAGAGVRDTIGNRQISLGNTALMAQVGASIDELKSPAELLRTEGASVMYLSIDGKLAGLRLAVTRCFHVALMRAFLVDAPVMRPCNGWLLPEAPGG